MSYLVLARKYRPQTFSQVVGQEHVTRTLANAFAQERVHHAFLFCGPRGCGKTTTARILGKALNCAAGPTAEPCGECDACRSIADGSSVDYFEMDGASNRGIDAIRELTDAVRYQPAVLRKKVYVIDEVHMLTTEAFNALLKTLEEPPPHVTFVLATTEPHKVPNTILSRCQRYDFKLVPSSRLAEHIGGIFEREAIASEPGAVQLVVRESGGSVRDALSICDQIISYVGGESVSEANVAEILGVADRALTRSLVTSLASGDAQTALEAVDTAVARGVDEVQLARAIVRYLRDLAVTQVAPRSDELVDGSAEERDELRSLAEGIARPRVRQMFERVLRACEDLAQTQQPRMVLDLALIDVATQEPLVPLGDLIDRLGDLERRLGGGAGGGGARVGRGPAVAAARAPVSAAPSAPAAAPSAPGPAIASAGPSDPAPGRLSPDEASATLARASAALGSPPPAARAPNVPIELAQPATAPELARPDVARRDRARPPGRPERTDDEPPPWIAMRAAAGDDGPAPAPSIAEPPSIASPAPAPAAAPAPSPAPAAAVDVPADPLRAWETVITALDEARQISLVTAYQGAKILRWDASGVEVGFAADGFTTDIASSQAKIDEMQAFLARHFGRPIPFRVRRLSPEEEAQAVSILEDAEKRAEEDREQRRREAREHPLTRVVLDTFGATIKEIKTHV